jgi:hypothetical protein
MIPLLKWVRNLEIVERKLDRGQIHKLNCAQLIGELFLCLLETFHNVRIVVGSQKTNLSRFSGRLAENLTLCDDTLNLLKE